MIEVHVDARALSAEIQRAVRARPQAIQQALNRAGQFHTREAKLNFGPGRGLRSRSGGLRNSINYVVTRVGNDHILTMFSAGRSYARIQEFGSEALLGGPVRPRTRQFMTVPLAAALTSSGARRGGALLVKDGRGYRTADGVPTFVRKARNGNLYVFMKVGRKVIPLYLLRRAVRLQPRMDFRRTFAEKTAPFLISELARVGA